ncbi:MAG: glycine cleavage T C-terminal barrel domain-containing protein [Myxococcota bacterium]
MILRTAEYRERLDVEGAQWSEHGGAAVVAHFGSVDDEWRAVRQGGIGVADRAERETFVLTGTEAIPWLQGLVTNDLFALVEEGSGQRTHAVNRIGRAIADARVLHIPEMLLLDLEPGTVASGFAGHLRRHIINEDVKLTDRTVPTGHLGVYGMDAAEFLAELMDTAHPIERLQEYQGTWGSVAGEDVIVQRIPLVGEPSFELMFAREANARLFSLLLEHSAAVRPIGFDALEELRKEAGVPRFGVEYDDSIIPIEADLNHTIDYDKGCYLGQEVIHRLDTRGTPAKFLRMVVTEQEHALSPGDVLEFEGKKVGELRDVFTSRHMARTLALAYIKRGAYDEGTSVDVTHGEEKIPARVQPLGYPLNQDY